MIIEHANKSLDELTRIAEIEDNRIALAILEQPDVDENELAEQLESCISDIADFVIDQIDTATEKMREYYVDPESDHHDHLWEWTAEHFDTDNLSQHIDNFYDGFYHTADFETITDRITQNLEYYCEIEISSGYAAPRGVSINSYCLGEIEEQVEYLHDLMPKFSDIDNADRITEYVLKGLDVGPLDTDADYFFFDLSDTYANLVLKAETMDELFAAE